MPTQHQPSPHPMSPQSQCPPGDVHQCHLSAHPMPTHCPPNAHPLPTQCPPNAHPMPTGVTSVSARCPSNVNLSPTIAHPSAHQPPTHLPPDITSISAPPAARPAPTPRPPSPPLPMAVKEEPCDEAPPARSPPGRPQDVTAAELLRRLSVAGGEELLFLQLPDSLPGQPPAQDSKPSRAELQSDDGQLLLVKQEKGQEARQADCSCTLADLPEGQLGKLVVRRSGRVQLVLGRVTLDVTMGTPCSFLQELVSVGIGDGRTGEMTVLGHVKHKLVCSPDFEALLEHRHR
ncbi:DNA-directed RNA polymerase III subunit RPC4 [Phasianus colchicus]|nr:DNA-directed RNA polymerase III subunit RPC4 [Phasianus colchicus]